MLPPDSTLPLDVFVFIIAAEACLTARKHLVRVAIMNNAACLAEKVGKTDERAFILIFSMNSSGDMSESSFVVATPALYYIHVNP